MYNTNSLGYKLLNNKIKKHSEKLNKFVAGLFDSDGCVSIKFNSHGNSSYNIEEKKYTISLTLQIDQSASNDPDHQMMRALKDHYNIGTINYRARENWAHQAVWSMGLTDAKIFFNLVGKHLLIKKQHVDNLIWLVDNLSKTVLTETNIQELKEYSICSRDTSAKLASVKHISPNYLSGLIAGDGWITASLNRPRVRDGWLCRENQMNCAISLHHLDSFVLNLIQKDYGGKISNKDKDMKMWKRSLGKQNKIFAIRFCKDIMESMCIPKKYEALSRILKYHELPAETKCLSLERGCDSPRR